MADTKISAATLRTPQAGDMVPLAVSGSTTAYYALLQPATTAAKGLVELATTTEAKTGTSTSLAVTPEGMATYFQNSPVVFGVHGTTEGAINLGTSVGSGYMQFVTEHASFYGHVDTGCGLGYNIVNRVSGQHTWSLGMESDYYTSAVTHDVEAYFAYTDSAQTTSRRPFQVNVSIDTNLCTLQSRGTWYHYLSPSDTLAFKYNEATQELVVGEACDWIMKLNNNAQWIRQYTAAEDGTYVSLIYLNSANGIQIGNSNEVYVHINKPLIFGSGVPSSGLTDNTIVFGGGDAIMSCNYGDTNTLKQMYFATNSNVYPFEIDMQLGHSGGYVVINSNFSLPEQTAQPSYVYDGMIVYADGTSWNPGSGEGFYGRVNGAWVKL